VSDPAILALEDGRIFEGRAIGEAGHAAGEVVFNTAMTGYQEILTDPSYCQQIVTLTYPHIGNYGTSAEDMESDRVQAAGLVVRDLPLAASNWRSEEDLAGFLRANKVVAIAEVDTRALTRSLREHGAQRGCIMTAGPEAAEQAVAYARAFPGLEGADLAQVVSTGAAYGWREPVWRHAGNEPPRRPPAHGPIKVVAYDYGIKRNILRLLVERGCEVTVLPARTPAAEALALQPDGVFLSNGPGDPEPCDYAVAAIAEILATGTPVFGICLGHQLLALACGARTRKMSFGHHGANHPVLELATEKVMITSQNHGFTVDEDSLPPELLVTHRSLFDGSLQGIHHRDRPAFGFQGHPEASPGPHDMRSLFDHFIELMRASGRG